MRAGFLVPHPCGSGQRWRALAPASAGQKRFDVAAADPPKECRWGAARARRQACGPCKTAAKEQERRAQCPAPPPAPLQPASGWLCVPRCRCPGPPPPPALVPAGQESADPRVSADLRQTRPASAPREPRRRGLGAPRAVAYRERRRGSWRQSGQSPVC